MITDEDDNDDDAVAAPRAGQVFTGRRVSVCQQLPTGFKLQFTTFLLPSFLHFSFAGGFT